MTSASQPWHMASARLVSITDEITDVATFDLELDQPFSYSPGQFNMLYVPGVGEAAISLSGKSNQRLHHTIRRTGNVTQSIAKCPIGSTLGLRGPFGSSWPMQGSLGKDIILATGGIGLPPVRPVIYEVMQSPAQYGHLSVLYGARTPDGLLYTREYDTWQQAGITVQTIVDHADPSWVGQVGVITQLLHRCVIQRPEHTILMTCGPEVMMYYVAKEALSRGIPIENIYVSLERHMNCAIGLCGHCLLGPSFVCKDGPVFRYDRIAHYMKVQGL